MKVTRKQLYIAWGTGLVIAVAIGFWHGRNGGNNDMGDNNQISIGEMRLTSPAFKAGKAIPIQYGCKGDNVNPPLNIMKVPEGAQSLALIMHDPDAPSGDYVHWTMWDIPTDTETIAANSVPVGAVQGLNGAGENKYMGPCPPSGTHHYMFELYALDKMMSLPANTSSDELKDAINDEIIEQHILTGTFAAQ